MRKNRMEKAADWMKRLDQMDQEDEDKKTLEEAYESLLEAYQEARGLNDELSTMVHEYYTVYGPL